MTRTWAAATATSTTTTTTTTRTMTSTTSCASEPRRRPRPPRTPQSKAGADTSSLCFQTVRPTTSAMFSRKTVILHTYFTHLSFIGPV
ncbi:jg811, partial [Pararge aegeria aegeria]